MGTEVKIVFPMSHDALTIFVDTVKNMHFKSLIALLRRAIANEESGEGGIRTHGGRKDHNGFRDRPNRPLWHLSNQRVTWHGNT